MEVKIVDSAVQIDRVVPKTGQEDVTSTGNPTPHRSTSCGNKAMSGEMRVGRKIRSRNLGTQC